MPSEADLLNSSLALIGAKPITGIDEGTQNANWCKTLYPPLRRAVLSLHHWNFAEDRLKLSQGPTPAFGFAYSYPLPDYVLKIKEFYGANPTNAGDPVAISWASDLRVSAMATFYKVEQRNVLTNYGEAFIIFIRDIDNPTLWSPLFYQILSVWLSGYLAGAISKDTQKAVAKIREAVDLLLPLGAAVDGQEGSIVPPNIDDLTWGRR